MQSQKMSSQEKRAVFNISAVMSLRMLGLFMVLPLFSLYAHQLKGATPFLIGLAMGIYGLGQALFQIPFGALSDRFGRKPIIVFGLSIFILGSLLSADAHSITLLIIGRSLQGMGAVGSTLLAMMADLTREEQRTKAMAIAGITIGFSFSLAMGLGPLLMKWFTINQLFIVSAFLSFIGIVLLYTTVPTPTRTTWHRDTEPELQGMIKILCMPELLRLNFGIFVLHAIFTASFIVIPIALLQYANLSANQQWLMYLPALAVAFIASLFGIGMAERKRQLKEYFIAGIIILFIAESILWKFAQQTNWMALGVTLFFTGFSLLEAFLPSLISRTAPAHRKGSALGIYSCSQFLGIFVGGVIGGWLFGQFHFAGVYLFCLILTFAWLILAFFMQPRYLITQILRLSPQLQSQWASCVEKLKIIPGMAEVSINEEKAYLKMDRSTLHHPDFIEIKTLLQSESSSSA